MFIARHEFANSVSESEPESGANNGMDIAQSDLLFDNTTDYMFWSLLARQDQFKPGTDLKSMAPNELRDLVLDMTLGWHERLRALVSGSDLSTMATWPMRIAPEIGPWNTSRVTLIGDAIHSMPPTGGIGGNTALRDAELLSGKLSAVSRGEVPLTEAVNQYEAGMLAYAFDAVRFSGSLLQTATSDNALRNTAQRVFFRTVDHLPAIKRRMFAH